MAEWDSGLVIEGVDLESIDHDQLDQELEALYELEYKHAQINIHDWDDEEPKEDILELAEENIRVVTSSIAEKLASVFEDWLKQHAITEPKKWAKAQIQALQGEDPEYPDVDPTQAIEGMANTYWRLTHEDQPTPYYQAGIATNFFDSAMENAVLDRMPALKEWVETYMVESRQMAEEDWKEEEEEEEFEWPYEDDPQSFYEEYILGEKFSSHFENFIAPNEYEAWDILEDIEREIVFSAWIDFWGPRGIKDTRRRVEKASKDALHLSEIAGSESIGKVSVEINRLINIAHQTGTMIDYIENRWSEVNEEFLTDLSESDTEVWDEELTEMGVLQEMDPEYETRRAAEAARAVFREDIRKRITESLLYGKNPIKLLPRRTGRLVRRMQ